MRSKRLFLVGGLLALLIVASGGALYFYGRPSADGIENSIITASTAPTTTASVMALLRVVDDSQESPSTVAKSTAISSTPPDLPATVLATNVDPTPTILALNPISTTASSPSPIPSEFLRKTAIPLAIASASATPSPAKCDTPSAKCVAPPAETGIATLVNTAVLDQVKIGLDETNYAELSQPTLLVKQGEGMFLRARSGSAAPNETVMIYVMSEPKTYTISADSTGFWFVYLDTNELALGDHRIEYETPTKPRAQLLTFQVSDADEPATPPVTTTQEPEIDISIPAEAGTASTLMFWLWWLASLVILLIAIIGYSLYHKHSKQTL